MCNSGRPRYFTAVSYPPTFHRFLPPAEMFFQMIIDVSILFPLLFLPLEKYARRRGHGEAKVLMNYAAPAQRCLSTCKERNSRLFTTPISQDTSLQVP